MPNTGVTPIKERVKTHPERGLWRLLGPAFVASIAYVDPGNVAANLTAGAEYGYLLVWVLVASNSMAVLVQYLSAKLGLVTGRSLPELIAVRMGRGKRLSFWLQAEVVAAATDVAEVVGGAIALSLLFHIPLVWGGVITGVVSMALLAIQSRRGQQPFELAPLGEQPRERLPPRRGRLVLTNPRPQFALQIIGPIQRDEHLELGGPPSGTHFKVAVTLRVT